MNAALLINLLGFSVGIALYALLAVMVLRHRGSPRAEKVDFLLLATAALGLCWNLGELYVYVRTDLGTQAISPLLAALSYSALGFLPSVVVHSANPGATRGGRVLTFAAYVLSAAASMMHIRAALAGAAVPSDGGLQTLTFGSLALVAGLLIFNLRQTREKKAIFAAALLVFAVSALHLSGEREGASWLVELIAHQSSLPLALVILYQNYRFAFADLFLKRAVSLMLLASLALGLYVWVAVPLLRYHETHDRDDVQAAALVIGLWIATALAYPQIYRFAGWLVDKVLLARADYEKLEGDLAREIESIDAVEAVLNAVRDKLRLALTAESSRWSEGAGERSGLLYAEPVVTPDSALIIIPTAEEPRYTIELSDFAGGRRLLSDEIALLRSASIITARRIDLVRVAAERYEQRFREQEFAKLATEAQLAALRAQINPHFLFNALTTIGYLIKAAPDKAYDTLLHLTRLLRGVLNAGGDFSTLGDEITLIENYLEIEHARFEERLSVDIDIPEELRPIRIPSLILQPVVENAVKHAVSENKNGGRLRITASMTGSNGDSVLHLTVTDTGSGSHRAESKGTGVGLRNVRERLTNHYGTKARLELEFRRDAGRAEIEIPVGDHDKN